MRKKSVSYFRQGLGIRDSFNLHLTSLNQQMRLNEIKPMFLLLLYKVIWTLNTQVLCLQIAESFTTIYVLHSKKGGTLMNQ